MGRNSGGREVQIRVSLPVKEPEGHIDALDLLDVVFRGEGPGQQMLALVEFSQGFLGRLLIQLEGQDIVRLEHAVKLGGHHGGVAAVGAAGGGGGGVTDQLRAAGGAAVGLHARLGQVPFRILRADLGGLGRGRGLGFFLGGLGYAGSLRLVQLFLIQGLDLLHGKAAAAVVADELAAAAVIAQRARTGRALIIGDLRGHICPPLVRC